MLIAYNQVNQLIKTKFQLKKILQDFLAFFNNLLNSGHLQ